MFSSPILYGVMMALIDVVVLSSLQMYHLRWIKSGFVLLFSYLAYGFQALLFYKSLSISNLTLMNLLWDVISDVMVTIVGLYVFKEQISTKQYIGIAFAFLAMILMK